jgi:hypothetical protein
VKFRARRDPVNQCFGQLGADVCRCALSWGR